MEKVHFEWKDEYSVHVKLLDGQHQKLIKTIDDLYQAILEGKDKEALGKIFLSINEYANAHFSSEEKYFIEFDYSEAAVHEALHEKFKKDVREMESRINDKNFSALELLVFLENWWVNHIMDVDKRYSEFFNSKGLY